jgi:hypothetical protein
MSLLKNLFENIYRMKTQKQWAVCVWLFVAALMTSLSSCKKQSDSPSIPTDQNKRVWIINEGNFQFGNASIDIYLPDSQTVFKNIYKTVNQKNLGDVAQSGVLSGKKLFVVVNNSSKISVLNTADYREIQSISLPQSSPRYLQFVHDNKAFVTELYAKKIWIINPNSGNLIDTITTEGWTEQMALVGNEIFIAQRTRLNDVYVANVLVVDARANKILKKILLPSEPNSLVELNNFIWVLCSATTTQPARLVKIDPRTKNIEKTIDFPVGRRPMLLRANPATQELFWVSDGVYKLKETENNIPSTPLVPGNGRNIYALDVNSDNGEIYIADAIDYVQSSSIFRYDRSGKLVHTFKAGIITNSFIFE